MRSCGALDSLGMGVKRFHIDCGMLMHKGFFAHPQCTVPGADLERYLQWEVEKGREVDEFWLRTGRGVRWLFI